MSGVGRAAWRWLGAGSAILPAGGCFSWYFQRAGRAPSPGPPAASLDLSPVGRGDGVTCGGGWWVPRRAWDARGGAGDAAVVGCRVCDPARRRLFFWLWGLRWVLAATPPPAFAGAGYAFGCHLPWEGRIKGASPFGKPGNSTSRLTSGSEAAALWATGGRQHDQVGGQAGGGCGWWAWPWLRAGRWRRGWPVS